MQLRPKIPRSLLVWFFACQAQTCGTWSDSIDLHYLRIKFDGPRWDEAVLLHLQTLVCFRRSFHAINWKIVEEMKKSNSFVLSSFASFQMEWDIPYISLLSLIICFFFTLTYFHLVIKGFRMYIRNIYVQVGIN